MKILATALGATLMLIGCGQPVTAQHAPELTVAAQSDAMIWNAVALSPCRCAEGHGAHVAAAGWRCWA